MEYIFIWLASAAMTFYLIHKFGVSVHSAQVHLFASLIPACGHRCLACLWLPWQPSLRASCLLCRSSPKAARKLHRAACRALPG
jgi:hypothetical protein